MDRVVEEAGGTIERLLVLKAMPLFADVAPEDLAVIADHAEVRDFAEGDRLYSGDGQPATRIHLVLSGRVAEHRGGRLFRTHGPQHVVGGMDALAQSSAGAMAVAGEATRTLSIDRQDLAVILEDNFAILWVTLQGVAAATLRARRRLPSAGFLDRVEAGDRGAEAADSLAGRIAFLGTHTALGRMKIRTLAQLVHDAEQVERASREPLWTSGDPAEYAVVVMRGMVDGATREGQRFRAGPGAVLGLEEVLAMEPRWYGARTRGDCVLMSISRSVLVDTLEDASDSALAALAAMATIAAELHDRLAREDLDVDPV